jgi:hypothetical protein
MCTSLVRRAADELDRVRPEGTRPTVFERFTDEARDMVVLDAEASASSSVFQSFIFSFPKFSSQPLR